MDQNPLQEKCPNCGSDNVYIYEHWMSLRNMLAMCSTTFGLFAPIFMPRHLIGKEGVRVRRQDKKYICYICNYEWRVPR